MTSIVLKEESLKALAGKVVVISGGARGIGAATVSQCYHAGAHVVHGDWDEVGGAKLDEELASRAGLNDGTTNFVKTDVTSYDSVLGLFKYAFAEFGKIDIAISNAGITEVGNWFDPKLDLESITEKPSTKVIDVNLVGCLYFSRIAAVYLRQHANSSSNKSLVLVSSTAGFKETPGLFVYQASKHGVLGLMRSLRLYLPKASGANVRVNAICPWMTNTGMVDGIREDWFKEGLPVNQPEDVARIMIEVAVDEKLNGTAVFVEGGRGWDIEEGIDRTEPQWLGEHVSKTLAKGQEALGDGMGWDTSKR